MNKHNQNPTGNDGSREPQEPNVNNLKTPGAPSNAYFFTVLGTGLVFAGGLLAVLHFGLENPDGSFNSAALDQWESAHPALYLLAGLAAAALDIATVDIIGWKVATWFAALRHGKAVTERQVASTRLAVQILGMALFVIAFSAFPTYLPRPNGHFPFIGLALLAVPVLLAVRQLSRAQNNQ